MRMAAPTPANCSDRNVAAMVGRQTRPFGSPCRRHDGDGDRNGPAQAATQPWRRSERTLPFRRLGSRRDHGQWSDRQQTAAHAATRPLRPWRRSERPCPRRRPCRRHDHSQWSDRQQTAAHAATPPSQPWRRLERPCPRRRGCGYCDCRDGRASGMPPCRLRDHRDDRAEPAVQAAAWPVRTAAMVRPATGAPFRPPCHRRDPSRSGRWSGRRHVCRSGHGVALVAMAVVRKVVGAV